MATAFYTFKGIPVPKENERGWDRYLETTYEDDSENWKDNKLKIHFKELLLQGEIGLVIENVISQGISPEIFLEMILINGGETLEGKMDWNSLIYTSNHPPRSQCTYIGIYVDKEYINQYILLGRDNMENRMQISKHPDSRAEQIKKYRNEFNETSPGPDKGPTV